MATPPPPVVLFGYDSSPFTQKLRLALRLKQVSYTFIPVPSMMPRPILRDTFHLTYRKIPVLAIGQDVFCDTSIAIEAIEHIFRNDHRSLYPAARDGRTNRAMIRGFASYWTDRPFFRVATGLIPAAVWRTSFGVDRAGLIGHKLNADKLEAKIPRNLAGLDLQLGLFEAQLSEAQTLNSETPWLFSTPTPSLADISLFYQLDWANNIAAGHGIENLTGGGTDDTNKEGTQAVFNKERYPAVCHWFHSFRDYVDSLPACETRVDGDPTATLEGLKPDAHSADKDVLLPTLGSSHRSLNEKLGLHEGIEVSVAPDDTGRDDPTIGKLIALSSEEVVIQPKKLVSAGERLIDARVHFPRLGFVVQPTRTSRL